MPTNTWRGDAAPVAKVVTLTVGSNTNTHTFITTVGGRSFTVTADGVKTTTQLAADVLALLSASTDPRVQEVVWEAAANVVTGTARTPGKPFAISVGGTGTYTLATPTANSGPNAAGLAANWSLGTLPADGDDVVIPPGSPALLYDLDLITADDFASLTIGSRVGLPYRDEQGGYVQYRRRHLQVGDAVPVTIGSVGAAGRTGPELVNLAQVQEFAVTVLGTANPLSGEAAAVNLSGGADGAVVVSGGYVGLATGDDTLAAAVETVTVNDGGTVTVGPGATVAAAVNCFGGTVVNRGAVEDVVVRGGLVAHYGTVTGGVELHPVRNGTSVFDWRTGGTIATVTAYAQQNQEAPVVECGDDPRPKTITNGSFTGGAVLNDPDGSVVMSNPLGFDRESTRASDLGPAYTLSRTVT